jgi:hypothetical protein
MTAATYRPSVGGGGGGEPQMTRLAMATFWHTFHHDGEFSPALGGWGVHALPFSLYLPSRAKLNGEEPRRMFMDVRMCECIVCMKEKLIK